MHSLGSAGLESGCPDSLGVVYGMDSPLWNPFRPLLARTLAEVEAAAWARQSLGQVVVTLK